MADTDNHTIRKVVVSTGETTTLAGSAGVSGTDDGTGAAARFNRPAGIFGDSSGNLYVTELSNHTVRKVTTGGVVTTIAGSAGNFGTMDADGTAARFSGPIGIAGDGTYLYIVDSDNHTIRKVLIASPHTVTTLAGLAGTPGSSDGTGIAAQFKNPVGITEVGTILFVTDTGNDTIRQINSIGDVTTIAGAVGVPGSTDTESTPLTGARFNGPEGIWGDTCNGLYVTDRNNRTIRKLVDCEGGGVTTPFGTVGSSGFVDATGASARFVAPRLIFGHSGVLYVAEDVNHAIREITISSSAVSTLAGSPNPKSGTTDETGSKARFDFPGGTWGDGLGNLYVTDTVNHTIRKVVLSSGAVTTFAGVSGTPGSNDGAGDTATFNFPEGLWGDGLGNLYVADFSNNLIRKIVISTQVVSTLAGSGAAALTNGIGTGAAFHSPHAIWGTATTLYVADKDNHVIRKIDLTTDPVTVSTFAGTGLAGFSNHATGTSAEFDLPLGIWGDDSNVYVSEGGNHTIRKIEIGGTQTVTTIAGTGDAGSVDAATGTSATFDFPHELWGDGTQMWVVDLANHTIRKVAIASPHAVITVAGSGGSAGFVNGTGSVARFNFPQTIWGDGLNLYVADGDNHQVRKLNPDIPE